MSRKVHYQDRPKHNTVTTGVRCTIVDKSIKDPHKDILTLIKKKFPHHLK